MAVHAACASPHSIGRYLKTKRLCCAVKRKKNKQNYLLS